MGIVSGIVVFCMIWWTVLFAVLPWGVERNSGAERGHDPGAPKRALIARKFLVTTSISVVLWVAVYVVVEMNLFSFRDWAQSMPTR